MNTQIERFKFKKQYSSANILELSIETTGPIGGDSGHGGMIQIKLKDLGSTDMRANGVSVGVIDIFFGGTTEYTTLLSALEDTVTFMKLCENRN